MQQLHIKFTVYQIKNLTERYLIK